MTTPTTMITVTLEIPAETTFTAGGETYTQAWEGVTGAMIIRAATHGLGQMVIDAGAMTREDMDGLSADEVAVAKRGKRHAAYAKRFDWMRSETRVSDDSVWMAEFRPFAKLVGMAPKAIAAIKTVAAAKAAFGTFNPAAAPGWIAAVDHGAEQKRAAMANPDAAVAALVAAALAAKSAA